MALLEKRPPKAFFEVASAAVNKLLVAQHGGAMAAAATGPEIAAPHAVYTFGLSDIAKGKLSAAKRVGWRYLVMQQDAAVAAAQVNQGAGGTASFSHLNSGPFVAGTKEALEFTESLPDVQRDNYEVRLLSIPALYQMAIWLHGKTKDLLVPVPSPTQQAASAGANSSAVQPNHAYLPAEYFAALLPHAQHRLQLEQGLEEGRTESGASQSKGASQRPRASSGAKKPAAGGSKRAGRSRAPKTRRAAAKKVGGRKGGTRPKRSTK